MMNELPGGPIPGGGGGPGGPPPKEERRMRINRYRGLKHTIFDT